MVNDEDRLVSALVALRAALQEGRMPYVEVLALLQILFEIGTRVLAVNLLPAMSSSTESVSFAELLEAVPCGDSSESTVASTEEHQATERLRAESYGLLEDVGRSDLFERLAELSKDRPFLRAVVPILIEFAKMFVSL